MNNYELITNMIIEKLEEGIIPWRSPFRGHNVANANWLSKKAYRGINAFLTSMMGYKSPYWLTFKQIKDINGAKLIKGSKGVPILFAKYIDKEDENGNIQKVAIYRRSYVFNLQFIEGIDCPIMERDKDKEMLDFNSLENAEQFLKDINGRLPEIHYINEYRAYYNSGSDRIFISNKEQFQIEENYYSTLFHEIIHSTGHADKCNRDLTGNKKSKRYAKEELTAEIGASFLCGETGILNATVDNNVSYIKSWLSNLRNDPKMIVYASSKAQLAVDYLKS